MSSGISEDKKLSVYKHELDTLEKQLDLSNVCIPFSIFFEEISSEKKGVSIKNIPFSKLNPELRTILRKEFLE